MKGAGEGERTTLFNPANCGPSSPELGADNPERGPPAQTRVRQKGGERAFPFSKRGTAATFRKRKESQRTGEWEGISEGGGGGLVGWVFLFLSSGVVGGGWGCWWGSTARLWLGGAGEIGGWLPVDAPGKQKARKKKEGWRWC